MTWAGTSLAERQAARREKLLDAALDLLGTQGGGAVTVRSVCRHTKLTDRYFYENFAGREELLLAVYDRVAAEAKEALQTAVAQAPPDPKIMARAAVEAFLAVIVDDPRKGRVLLLEPMTEATLSARGHELMPMFAELVRAKLGQNTGDLGSQLTATALIGALSNLFIRWLDGSLPAARADLVEFCVNMLVTAAALSSARSR